MKKLLIMYSFYPFDRTSTRWIHFAKHLKIDTVLTCKTPKGGRIDRTLPDPKVGKIVRKWRLPGIQWTFFIIPRAIIQSFFYDVIIVTSPPDSLISLAFILKLFQRNVFLDLRDDLNRDTTSNFWLVPFWKWCYNRLDKKKTCVTMRFFDPAAKLIRHGYIVSKFRSLELIGFVLGPDSRINYSVFWGLISMGAVKDFNTGIVGDHMTSSTLVTIRKLHGDKNLWSYGLFDKEMFEFKPVSINRQALKFKWWLYENS